MTDEYVNFSFDATFDAEAGDEGRFDLTLHNISPEEIVYLLPEEVLIPLAGRIEAALAGDE